MWIFLYAPKLLKFKDKLQAFQKIDITIHRYLKDKNFKLKRPQLDLKWERL